MIHFPDTTLQRYTYNNNATGIYGETVQKYKYADDITVDFQNENNQEIAKEYGVELQNLYKIYLDLGVTLNDNDQLRDSNGNKYHIVGQVQKYKKFHKYQRAHIVRDRA